MLTGYIYILTDSRYCDGHHKHVRYVGMTFDLKKRIKEHLRITTKKLNHRTSWLKNALTSDPNCVSHVIIEEIVTDNRTEVADREIYWIAQFKAWGFSLTNSTSGGEGIFDLPEDVRRSMGEQVSKRLLALGDNHHTKRPEVRAKISAANSGENSVSKRPEVRAKMSINRKGKMLGDLNPSKRPEVRAKISERKRGRADHHSKTPENRKRHSEFMKGRYVGDLNPSKKPGVGDKISSGRRGKSVGADNPRSLAVVCCETGVTYQCAQDAANFLHEVGFPRACSSSILGCCRGKYKQCHGYTWIFA